eukprot:TRINITY_DN14519_c0_g2_i2.p1 TRINITY_DN14519_c0_g2~~TRINITY_DN14519_c0_g2_i2.p1  ORF type:complete len:301 (-),score=23.78 TRINITY_DN14519_c0_g2_i2:656-1558(-)
MSESLDFNNSNHWYEKVNETTQAAAADQAGVCVLILPGGGYHYVEYWKEGKAIADWLLTSQSNSAKAGLTGTGCVRAVFVLNYSETLKDQTSYFFNAHRPAKSMTQALGWAKKGFHKMKEQCAALGGRKLVIMGFSAGAHLAMSLIRSIGEETYSDSLSVSVNLVPASAADGLILVYPPAFSPTCPACLLRCAIRLPFGGWRPLRYLPYPQVKPHIDHRWCDMKAVAQFAPKSVLLVGSTQDNLLPNESNHDVIQESFKDLCEQLTSVKRELGDHGFALQGWEEDLRNWLHAVSAEELRQ